MRIALTVAFVMILFSAALAENKKEFVVELQVPDTTWTIQIGEVYEIGNELWVISHLSQETDVVGAQVISAVTDSLELDAPDLPVKYFVVGKNWHWDSGEPYIYISSINDIESDLNAGRILYTLSK